MARSGTKMVLAGITGLAAGIAIGILFAPAKGTKTRKRLKKRIMGMANVLEDTVADRFGALKSILSDEEEELEEE